MRYVVRGGEVSRGTKLTEYIPTGAPGKTQTEKN